MGAPRYRRVSTAYFFFSHEIPLAHCDRSGCYEDWYDGEAAAVADFVSHSTGDLLLVSHKYLTNV